MIPSNILCRTFHIKYGNQTGTAFTIDIDNKQYFITAKHVLQKIEQDHENKDTVVAQLNAGDIIEIEQNQSWVKLQVSLAVHSPIADISIFAIPDQTCTYELTVDSNLIIGQELYFLGFPFGWRTEMGADNEYYPIPFVKKAILSSFYMPNITNTIEYMLLDGHNNPGFSGGPVIFKQPHSQTYYVCGVISGFCNEYLNVHNKQTGLTQGVVIANSGIIISYSIKHALDLIKDNPNGKIIIPR